MLRIKKGIRLSKPIYVTAVDDGYFRDVASIHLEKFSGPERIKLK
jgi:hypothetical protein